MFSLEDLNKEFNFIDWKVYFNSIMNDNTFPSKDDRFIVTTPQYLKEAAIIIKNALLEQDGIQILEDFLKWRILDSSTTSKRLQAEFGTFVIEMEGTIF